MLVSVGSNWPRGVDHRANSLCNHVLEVFDGSTEIAYRLTVAPEKLFE